MMNVLSAVSIGLPCNQCGRRYDVTLGQILLSHNAFRGSCVARGDAECEPLFHAKLLDRQLIEEFVAVWRRLEEATRASGGVLRIGRD
jgi:hypothetical protein